MLHETGIILKPDDLGRIVIPKKLRRELGIDSGQRVELLYDPEARLVALRAWEPGCVICGSREHLVQVKTRFVCRGCLFEGWGSKMSEVEYRNFPVFDMR